MFRQQLLFFFARAEHPFAVRDFSAPFSPGNDDNKKNPPSKTSSTRTALNKCHFKHEQPEALAMHATLLMVKIVFLHRMWRRNRIASVVT